MADEFDVHLVLSTRAAETLEKLIGMVDVTQDGAPLDHFDDQDEAARILDEIQTEIRAQRRGGEVKPKRRPKKKEPRRK